jgi:hypothetical protein
MQSPYLNTAISMIAMEEDMKRSERWTCRDTLAHMTGSWIVLVSHMLLKADGTWMEEVIFSTQRLGTMPIVVKCLADIESTSSEIILINTIWEHLLRIVTVASRTGIPGIERERSDSTIEMSSTNQSSHQCGQQLGRWA